MESEGFTLTTLIAGTVTIESVFAGTPLHRKPRYSQRIARDSSPNTKLNHAMSMVQNLDKGKTHTRTSVMASSKPTSFAAASLKCVRVTSNFVK